jgi:hypothetical protein
MKWVKPSDALPEDNQDVLFFDGDEMFTASYNTKYGFISCCYMCNDPSCNWIYDDCGCSLIISKDCYWMPLPPKP